MKEINSRDLARALIDRRNQSLPVEHFVLRLSRQALFLWAGVIAFGGLAFVLEVKGDSVLCGAMSGICLGVISVDRALAERGHVSTSDKWGP